MVNIRSFSVSESDANMRLDKFLSQSMPEFSRTEIQKFEIRDTKRETRKIKLSEKIKIGDEYIVEIPTPDARYLRPTACNGKIPPDVLYEDIDIIVVNKPRGISMYLGAGHHDCTLVQTVLGHTTLSNLGDAVRPGVVHRLDKDTSGAVVFAKTDAAYRALVKTFAAHDIVRKYTAFVWGVPTWESADITGNIGRSPRRRQKMTILKIGGKEAQTGVDIVRAWPRVGVSEFRCTLLTGRTHQIRVHLSGHGFPVLCDPLYGRGNSRLGSVRDPRLLAFLTDHHGQMLHAAILEFAHPITGNPMKFKAPLPEDMISLREILDDRGGIERITNSE